MKSADYRKLNDGSHSSSTYHKKDGTPVRAILKRDLREELRTDGVDARPRSLAEIKADWEARYGHLGQTERAELIKHDAREGLERLPEDGIKLTMPWHEYEALLSNED